MSNARPRWGTSITIIPDLTSDGIPELLVGGPGDDFVDLISLNTSGQFGASLQRYANGQGGFPSGQLFSSDFGSSSAFMGDLNQDGFFDFASNSFSKLRPIQKAKLNISQSWSRDTQFDRIRIYSLSR